MVKTGSTVFFCQDAPGIIIGPGSVGSTDTVRFIAGYAEVAHDDPRYDDKVGWIRAVRQYHIEELGDDDAGRVVPTESDKFVCPKCEEAGLVKSFGTRAQLNGHLMHHRPR